MLRSFVNAGGVSISAGAGEKMGDGRWPFDAALNN